MKEPIYERDGIMNKANKEDRITYQCSTCHFVLKQKHIDPPPSYCPHCAVNHLKGDMVMVLDSERSCEPGKSQVKAHTDGQEKGG